MPATSVCLQGVFGAAGIHRNAELELALSHTGMRERRTTPLNPASDGAIHAIAGCEGREVILGGHEDWSGQEQPRKYVICKYDGRVCSTQYLILMTFANVQGES